MSNVINLKFEDTFYGYCGVCGSDLFKLRVSGDDPEDAIVTGLECEGCKEYIELAPIVVELDFDDVHE